MRGLLLTSILLFSCGFVRVGEQEGCWWFLDEDDRPLFLSGVGGVRFSGTPCEMAGTHPYNQSLRAQGIDAEAWERRTGRRLRDWGFNFVTVDSRIPTFGLRYASNLSLGRDAARVSPDASLVPFESVHKPVFPNVFSPVFADACRRLAQERCAALRDDPLLVGWFVDNELLWTGGRRDGLFGLVAELPAGHSAKVALERFLSERGWTGRPVDDEMRRAFLAHVAERYFAVTTAAVREADPNHLVMGCRFAGIIYQPDELWTACGRHCDVVSLNFYPAADLDRGYVREPNPSSHRPVTDHFERVGRLAKKPILVTEWSFPGLDAGLPSLRGAGQRHRTQRTRAAATELCARIYAGLPSVIGFVHFCWCDQAPTGISVAVPENCNYGLVNVNDEPYAELVSAFAKINASLVDWHRAGVPPQKEKPPVDVAAKARALARPNCLPGSFVRQKNGAFAAENGAFRMEGRIGENRLRMSVGALRPLVFEIREGRKRWTPVDRLERVEGGVSDGVLGLTCAFSGGTGGSLRLTARVYLPAGRPYFLFEPVSITNGGEATTEVRGVYGVFEPPAGGTYVPGFASECRPYESLWDGQAFGAWIDTASGRFVGCVGSERENARVRYWKEGENLHGDAVLSFSEPRRLNAGESCTFAERPSLLFTFGIGGEWGWRRRLSECMPDRSEP